MKWKFLHSSALWNLTPLETCGPMVHHSFLVLTVSIVLTFFWLSITPSSYCHIHRVINLLKHEKAWMSEFAKIYIVQYSLEKHFWPVKGGEKQREAIIPVSSPEDRAIYLYFRPDFPPSVWPWNFTVPLFLFVVFWVQLPEKEEV
ncbi:hypothetical protein KIL84_003912 [Mauremys mutica]|uniref:Uncharacterized protein n=1 Tax=Mauremys mutica TaxID=74926 RepID=A0A9D3WQD5_9SAUR|nr:hypothetical protein KIL84_003912 [Mauremys mutica]